jgi:hypothetical protein
VERVREERRRLLRSVTPPARGDALFDYDAAVAFLVDKGLDDAQVREGSMPRESLDFVGELLAEHLPEGPLLGLHVGNFLGVSLAHLTATMRAKTDDVLVISVDPGMPHRGIETPDRVTLSLLDRFGLTANNLLVTGFSLTRNVRDDGYASLAYPLAAISDETAAATLREDAACEQVLPNLARLLPGRFDVAVLDGNHDGDYLREELRHVDVALRSGGLLVVDDIGTSFYEGVRDAFQDLSTGGGGYTELGNDGRVGVLARTLDS